jgi:adenylate kinase
MIMKNKYSAILIFGPPGIGKGTQAKLLAENKKYFHFSTGEMFRGLQTNPEMVNSEIGKKVHELISAGNFVDDQTTIQLFFKTFEEYIKEKKFNPKKQTLLLDGIPRNSNQVDLIKEKIEVVKLIYFYCSDDNILVERLKKRAILEKRKDDNEEVIRKRLKIYKVDTEAVLKKYDESLILRINGMNSIEGISREVVNKL